MEANRKRRGFMKVKSVMAFYRAAKPPSTISSTMQYTTTSNNVLMPNQASPPAASVMGYVVSQDYVISQPKPKPKPKVSFIVDYNGGDETVDAKAASYISCVQERFKLERINSERKKYHDMQ